MPIPQSVHIASEVVLIGGMAAYFNKKIGKLQVVDGDICAKIDKINQTIWHQRDVIEKLQEKVELLTSSEKQSQVPSSGKQSQVPSSGKQSQVPSSEKQSQVHSSGKQSQVPSSEHAESDTSSDCQEGYCVLPNTPMIIEEVVKEDQSVQEEPMLLDVENIPVHTSSESSGLSETEPEKYKEVDNIIERFSGSTNPETISDIDQEEEKVPQPDPELEPEKMVVFGKKAIKVPVRRRRSRKPKTQ